MIWHVAFAQLVAAILLFGWVLWVTAFYWGARWAKFDGITFRRAAWIGLLVLTALMGWRLLLRGLAPADTPPWLIVGLDWLGPPLLAWTLIAKLCHVSLWRAVWATLPTLLAEFAVAAVLLLLVFPNVAETFQASTNSMAPTILGRHLQAECPTCQRLAYFSPGQPDMICSQFHIGQAPSSVQSALGQAGDQIVVWKQLRPRRFDLVAFRPAHSPDDVWLMRVIGMPGETIELRDDAVWVDGVRLTLPESLSGIKHLSQLDHLDQQAWGADEPVALASDEYFVLGDFSANAYDSRFWQAGVEGHPPYALPESHIVGVATQIYWPPERIRILRQPELGP